MTTAQSILDAAVAMSLANDQGQTTLANNTSEALGVLNRQIRVVYTLAALPPSAGGSNRHGAMFTTQVPVTLGTPASTRVAFPSSPEIIRVLGISDAGDDVVAMVTVADVGQGVAEVPPAVIVENRTIRSAGRTGDPTAGAVLTLDVSYAPALLTSTAHYLGATTPTDATTSAWPAAGDSYLAHWLALYYCVKDGTRDAAEQQSLEQKLGMDAQVLAGIIGVSAAKLAAIEEDA